MAVTTVAITTNVATIGVQILEGAAPVVGQLVSIQGTQTVTSGGAPNFNVVNASITAISISFTTGIGTITFALTSSNIATTNDAGIALCTVAPVLETLPSSATAGRQFAVSAGTNAVNNQRGLTWFTTYSGSPSTVTINLQGADIDQDAYYTTVDASTNASGESRSLGNINYAFYRIQAASTGGSSPKFAAGIEVL